MSIEEEIHMRNQQKVWNIGLLKFKIENMIVKLNMLVAQDIEGLTLTLAYSVSAASPWRTLNSSLVLHKITIRYIW